MANSVERLSSMIAQRESTMISCDATRLFVGASMAAGLCLNVGPAIADQYPEAITGAWGGRAAYAGDDNSAQAQKACHSFRNPDSNELGGDVLVFIGSRKFSYGGYMDYIDDNVSVKQRAPNGWLVTDRHYEDGENDRKPGYRNEKYELELNRDVLTKKEGKDISLFNRCDVQARARPANISDWSNQLVELLAQHKYYPPEATRLHQSGTVTVSVVVARDGRLIDGRVQQGSRVVLFDHEALDLLNREQPFAPLPAEYSGAQITLSIPIRFDLGNSLTSLPSVVQAAIKQAQSACGTQQPALKPGFISAKDINGDGVTDYVLDYGKFECGGSSEYCGSAGCLTQVFVSLPGGRYVKVLDENVRGIRFDQRKGRPAEIIDVHGSACGRIGAVPCSMILFWNGQTFSPAN
jgi:TonB family protein